MTTKATRCPLCNRKFPFSELEGTLLAWCRHCKKLLRLDSRVLEIVR